MNQPDTAESQPQSASKFDAYATNYTELIQQNVAASGEGPEYFARYKVACLRRISARSPVLDFGCGIGNLTRHLVKDFSDVHGSDPSGESLRVARERVPDARFWQGDLPDSHFETAVVAGVMHHIPPAERDEALSKLHSTLRPGGKLVIFEHNPLNPLTRKAVKECPFDDDAILLWPRELRRRVKAAGFVDVKVEYIVFFPRVLQRLRPLEPHLGWLMLGAQTMTVARRA